MRRSQELTPTRRLILEYLEVCAKKQHYPSIREIGEAVGLQSSSTVHQHILALEEGGYIEKRLTSRSRNIHIKIEGEVCPTCRGTGRVANIRPTETN